jgi:hypothetical protein
MAKQSMHTRSDLETESITRQEQCSPEPNLETIGWFREILAGKRSSLAQFTTNDWFRFIDFACKHGIAPILYHAIKDHPPPGLSDNYRHLLRDIYLGSAHRNMLLYHELGKVLRALREADIPVVLLKGACLADAVYGNIALRSMGDVDLLVKQQDMRKIVQILGNLGYSAGYDFLIEDENASCHHLPPMIGPKKLTIEVHWNIVDFNHFYALEENDLKSLWRRAKPIVIDGAPVFLLSPEDLLLHLCLHLSVHHLFDVRLRGFLDLKKVIQCYDNAINWETLQERACHWGIDQAVRLSLYLADQWVGLNLPERLKHDWRLKEIDPNLLNWIEARIFGGTMPYAGMANLTEYIACRGIPAKVKVLWRRFFLPSAALSRQYKIEAHSWKVYLYYPIGWMRLFKVYGSTVWKALRGDAKVKSDAQKESALRLWLTQS